jgi:hypothetical protein
MADNADIFILVFCEVTIFDLYPSEVQFVTGLYFSLVFYPQRKYKPWKLWDFKMFP